VLGFRADELDINVISWNPYVFVDAKLAHVSGVAIESEAERE
jgi:hypothetical protein